ncbi:MAG: ABC transporter ATP-binding protein [Caldicoprobacterales bacterium]|jgi:ABC-2 type transport system ATP-binding protein|nr:ABC transporter ATP-binding protein [Clostridiales bacterium]
MENILEVKSLTKTFQDFTLSNISFSLPRGFITGFIGPNGSGKTTTIKLIMNLLKKDRGEVSIFGLDHIRHEREIKNRIGFVYDESHFYEELTVERMKRFIASAYNNWDEEKFRSLAGKFSLPLNKSIKDLSRGMKVKFSLAAALSHKADLLIMDEPTSGLDPVVRSEILDILHDVIQDENKGVFFSTHITSDLDRIADYIIMIYKGEILFNKTKDELIEEHAVIKGPLSLLDTSLKNNLIGIKKGIYGFEALTAGKEAADALVKAGAAAEKPALEDIMLYYTRKENGNA